MTLLEALYTISDSNEPEKSKAAACDFLFIHLNSLQPKVGPITQEVEKANEANKYYNKGWNDCLHHLAYAVDTCVRESVKKMARK